MLEKGSYPVSNIVTVAPPRKIPAEIMKLLGPPALWHGESRSQYDAMLLGMAISVGARDIVDWVSVNDVTYHVWDGRRLQAIKAALILARQIEVIERLLKSTYDLAGPERPRSIIFRG